MPRYVPEPSPAAPRGPLSTRSTAPASPTAFPSTSRPAGTPRRPSAALRASLRDSRPTPLPLSSPLFSYNKIVPPSIYLSL